MERHVPLLHEVAESLGRDDRMRFPTVRESEGSSVDRLSWGEPTTFPTVCKSKDGKTQ